ncbi:MAG: energy transducer TonB [Lentimicrobiaceae bacterium]|nr:energy transducer TonB [Lentimicrobiaceae bacterium]
MIEKKSSKGNLENRRSTFLLIGFIVVLGLVYAGFELYATDQLAKGSGPSDIDLITVIDMDVPVTDQTPPPPPPPQTAREILLKLVQSTPTFNFDPDMFSQDFPEDLEIGEYTPISIIDLEVEDSPPVVFPEEMPEPIGGFEAMYAFLKSNLRYPEGPRNAGISGQVFIEFVIERDGNISNVKVVMSVHPELDREAVRVVKMMPKWKPGKQMGKTVRTLYQIPIRFAIN